MKIKTCDGVDIHYEIAGNGKPLVMLNGLWGDTTSWDKQVEFFSRKYTCVRIDHRGIGKSGKWIGKYSYDLHANDLFEICNQLKLKDVVILGVCHGGMVATTFANKYSTSVRGIIINGTLFVKSNKLRAIFESWIDIISKTDFKSFYKNMVFPVIFSEKFIEQNYSKIENIVNATHDRISSDCVIEMIRACIDYGFSENDFKNTNVNALIMSGSEDGFIPKDQIEKSVKYWNRAQYYNFHDCGHFPQKEKTIEYNDVVNQYLESINYV